MGLMGLKNVEDFQFLMSKIDSAVQKTLTHDYNGKCPVDESTRELAITDAMNNFDSDKLDGMLYTE